MKFGYILVTGAAGFIGSHLTDQLINSGICEKVVAVDNLSMGTWDNLSTLGSDKLIRVEANIANSEELSRIFDMYDVDIVCHLATSPLVLSITDPVFVFENIVTMQKNILECQRNGKFKKLITFSTSEVYGSSDGVVLSETSLLKPQTPYASAKAAADLLTESYAKTFTDKIEYTIVRPFNNYGPRKRVLSGAGIIPQAIKAFAAHEPLKLVDNGETMRDFVFVEDTARAVIEIIKKPELTKNELFVIATGVPRKMKDISLDIAKLMHRPINIEYVPSRPGDVSYLKGSGRKIHSKLGFSPDTEWLEGLKVCIEYYTRLLP